MQPNSTLGDNLLWKKAQKKALKNINSDVINKIIPHSIPCWTLKVWKPHKVASRETSRHQQIIVITIIIIETGIKIEIPLWNHTVSDRANDIPLKDPVSGHGLILTRW